MTNEMGRRALDLEAIQGSSILVTGGAGFIGSNLVAALCGVKEVRILDDLTSSQKANELLVRAQANVDFINGTITDEGTLASAMKGIDIVFHMAALVSVQESIDNPGLSRSVNDEGTRKVIDAAIKAKVKRVVFSSSAAVYGKQAPPHSEDMLLDPLSPYAEHKIAGERHLLDANKTQKLETVVLRYFNVFGPGQSIMDTYSAVIPIFITKLLASEAPTIYGDGEQTRDFIHVADVVAANIRASIHPEAPGKVFNIARGNQITINELADLLVERIAPEIEVSHGLARGGEVRESFASIEKVTRILGFETLIEIKTGLQELINWHIAGKEN